MMDAYGATPSEAHGPRLLVTHGAIKNVGDFLIRRRGLSLLEHAGFDLRKTLVWPRWKMAEPSISRALGAAVLCGGPGLSHELYPREFPILRSLFEAEVPTSTLAQGISADSHRNGFSSTAVQALKRIASYGPLSVRDELSRKLVATLDIPATMTGCVAWYDLTSLGQPLRVKEASLRGVVVTPPAKPRLAAQGIELLRIVARLFPTTPKLCSFHRGIGFDSQTPWRPAIASSILTRAASLLGYETLDSSGDLQRIGRYREYDLHVGYRVHAHLDFLSRRYASVLIAEDVRGEGQQTSLQDPYMLRPDSRTLTKRLRLTLEAELEEGFPSSKTAIRVIDETWPTMEDYLGNLRRRIIM
jgi:hypothetical protein